MDRPSRSPILMTVASNERQDGLCIRFDRSSAERGILEAGFGEPIRTKDAAVAASARTTGRIDRSNCESGRSPGPKQSRA